MPPRLRFFYSVLLTALFLIPGLALVREFTGRSDIWWTPLAMATSLTDSQDRVQIYVRGEPLGRLVEQGQVSVKEGTGSHVISPQEIGLRFNNWDRVRAARLPFLLIYAAACGAGLILLLVTATGRLAYKAERETAAV